MAGGIDALPDLRKQHASSGGIDALPDLNARKSSPLVPTPTTLTSHINPKKIPRAGKVLQDFIAGAASSPIGRGAGSIFEHMARGGYAGAALGAHRGPAAALHAFMGGDSTQQHDADLNTLVARGRANAPFLNRVPDWLMKFGVGMAFDPTSYLGGSGLMKRGAMSAAEHALPLAVRAAPRVVSAAARISPKAEAAAQAGTDWLAKTHDLFSPGGALKRGLAATQPVKKGSLLFAHTYAERNNANRLATEITSAAHTQLDNVIKGLSPDDERKLYVALNSGALYRLPKALRQKARQFQQITDSLAYLMGTPQTRAKIVSQVGLRKFTLPEWAKPFDTSVRGLMKPGQFRQAYMPLTHDPRFLLHDPSEVEQDITRRLAVRSTRRAMTERSPNLLARTDLGLTLPDVSEQRDVIRRAFGSEARAIAAQDAKRNLGQIYGVRDARHLPNEVTHFLEQESQWDLGAAPKAIRGAVDLPKQGMFYLPFRHMMNIGSLAALHYPEALPQATKTFAQLLKAPEKAPDILKAGRAAGVAQLHSVDRNRSFARTLEKIPIVGKAAAAPYRWSNKTLWAWDDAVKDAAVRSAVKRLMRQGHSEKDALALAGKEVNDRLVDYSTRSDFTKLAGYAAPFATWRTKLPGSIARAMVEHPERILAAGRLNPALVGGQVPAPRSGGGQMTKIGMMNPLTDTFELPQHPARYLRSTLSYPYQAGLGAGESAISQAKGEKHPYPYFTYGGNPAQWLPYGALRSFPGMDTLMQRLPFFGKGKGGKPNHLNPFAPTDKNPVQDFLMQLLGGQTGIYLQRPRTP